MTYHIKFKNVNGKIVGLTKSTKSQANKLAKIIRGEQRRITGKQYVRVTKVSKKSLGW